MTKTYTNRSNAKRAAMAAGIPESEVELTVHKVAGEKPRFGFKRKEMQPSAPAKAATAAHRAPAAKATSTRAAGAQREQRAGIARPRAGGACDAVWCALDKHPQWKLADIRAWAERGGTSPNNAMIEFYRWRRFNGVSGVRAA